MTRDHPRPIQCRCRLTADPIYLSCCNVDCRRSLIKICGLMRTHKFHSLHISGRDRCVIRGLVENQVWNSTPKNATWRMQSICGMWFKHADCFCWFVCLTRLAYWQSLFVRSEIVSVLLFCFFLKMIVIVLNNLWRWMPVKLCQFSATTFSFYLFISWLWFLLVGAWTC